MKKCRCYTEVDFYLKLYNRALFRWLLCVGNWFHCIYSTTADSCVPLSLLAAAALTSASASLRRTANAGTSSFLVSAGPIDFCSF